MTAEVRSRLLTSRMCGRVADLVAQMFFIAGYAADHSVIERLYQYVGTFASARASARSIPPTPQWNFSENGNTGPELGS